MLFHCRAVKLPAVVRQTTHHTGACRGGHSSAKPTGPCHSTRNKKDQNDEDPLGSVPDIVNVDPAEDGIDKPKQVERRQVACRGKCFAPAQAPIRKIEEPKLKACSVVVDTDTPKLKKSATDDKPKPKLKKSATDDKPKPKSKKSATESVTPKEKSKENIQPKEQLDKNVGIPKEKETEVVSNETENVEPKKQSDKHVEIPEEKETENGGASYHMEHVAAYVKSVDDVETKDTKDGGTKQEKIRNIRESFEINRLECVIDKVITNRLNVNSTTEKIKCLKDILELLDSEFVKVDFTDVMHDETKENDTSDQTKENDASDKQTIEDETVKPNKPERRVTFKIDTADEKHEEEMSQISKDTDEAIAKLDQVIEDEETKMHRIDAAYINFPSSQEKFDLYKPETEDITDEDEPETQIDPVTGKCTFTNNDHKTEEKDVNDSEKKENLEEAEEEHKLQEEKKDESENQGKVVEPVEPEPECKLNEEQKKDETENKSEVVQPAERECKLDEEETKDKMPNQSEVVEPTEEQPEQKLDKEEKKDETENKSDVVQPVEPERKIDEKEEIPDGSQVQQTDGIPPDTKDDSDAESNSNLALTER